MEMAVVLQGMKLSIIMVALVVVHGSAGENSIAPSPAIFSAVSPSEERAPAHSYHVKSPKIPKTSAPNLRIPTTVPHFPGPPVVPPLSAPSPSISKKRNRNPVASPPRETSVRSSPTSHPPDKGSSPILSPAPQEATGSPNKAPPPLKPPRIPARKWAHVPAPSPLILSHNHHYGSKRASYAPSPSYEQDPLQSPAIPPKKSRQRHHQAPPNQVPAFPFPSTLNKSSPAPSPQTIISSHQTKRHPLPPTISPSVSFPRKPKALLSPPILALPPPPPNQDCTSVTCTEPLVNSPPGSLCGCVWPMQVGLRLSVALYTFFPLVTELANEIATGVFMKQSQVRIMGANAAGQQLDETIVLIDLVPLGQKFDYVTAISAYVKLWHKQIYVKPALFGDYEVLYVRYPGLPPSPPLVSSSITSLGEGLHSTRGVDGRTIHPLAVDVRRKHKEGSLGGSMIAIIALSSSIVMGLCIGAAWVFFNKRGESVDHGDDTQLTKPTSKDILPHAKPPATVRLTILGCVSGSTSPVFDSSIRAYTGPAKTFSADEIKRATDNFDLSRVLGEGGFGLVYRGILSDGSEVAVKVLKRNDQQGDREFLAEVEMLGRLHHRNLVKLVGICTEDRLRCLVYELIPNGSVDSHLHGVEREIAPLDWSTRMKIALGAARGLAYLHEDSNPRVIHRDFKSSNILLEHDCIPKVADFGLARSALDEGSKHISTRVMGTFGYVAPEYAMTGHLLVKSDVYSYGVVLLELLTGRKPVDMSQPQGQENLVTWARPLLTSKQGLELIIDPSLGTDFPLDSVAKVAAIASMCVQPEVSNRPFMGEVVQALKLVCDEFEETKGVSEIYSQEDLSLLDIDGRISMTSLGSGQHFESYRARYQMDYDSSHETTRPLSMSEVFSTSPRFARQDSGSFRRHSSSGPLRTGRSRQFWEKLRVLSRGSYSEHRSAFRL